MTVEGATDVAVRSSSPTAWHLAAAQPDFALKQALRIHGPDVVDKVDRFARRPKVSVRSPRSAHRSGPDT